MSEDPAGSRTGSRAHASRDHARPVPPVDDEQLVARLRDLTLVDLDVLLGGATPEQAAALLDAHAEDLADALRAARARMHADHATSNGRN